MLKTQQEKGKTAIYLKEKFQDCDYVHWKRKTKSNYILRPFRVQCPPAVPSSKSGQDFGHSA